MPSTNPYDGTRYEQAADPSLKLSVIYIVFGFLSGVVLTLLFRYGRGWLRGLITYLRLRRARARAQAVNQTAAALLGAAILALVTASSSWTLIHSRCILEVGKLVVIWLCSTVRSFPLFGIQPCWQVSRTSYDGGIGPLYSIRMPHWENPSPWDEIAHRFVPGDMGRYSR